LQGVIDSPSPPLSPPPEPQASFIDPLPLPSIKGGDEGEGDEGGLRRDAGTAFESTRLRPTRARNEIVKNGVSASGKGVKVAGPSKPAGPVVPSKKKGKGRAEPEIVCRVSSFDSRLNMVIFSLTMTSARLVGEWADFYAVMAVLDLFTSCV
jgi:hypothetical protein